MFRKEKNTTALLSQESSVLFPLRLAIQFYVPSQWRRGIIDGFTIFLCGYIGANTQVIKPQVEMLFTVHVTRHFMFEEDW